MARKHESIPAAAPSDASAAAAEDRFAAERAAARPRKTPAWERPVNPGRRFTVSTPNRQFNGERAGVMFTEGVGFTDDEAAAGDCARFGYEVEDHQQENAE